MHGRGNSYPPHVRRINDAFPGLRPLRFRRLPLVRQRQQYDCCQLIFKLPVLWRSGAAARLSSLHTPVETGAAPYWGFFGYCSNTRGKSVQPHEGVFALCDTGEQRSLRGTCALCDTGEQRSPRGTCALCDTGEQRSPRGTCALCDTGEQRSPRGTCALCDTGKQYSP